MNRRTSMKYLALGAVLALQGTLDLDAAVAEADGASGAPEVVRFDLSAGEICDQSSWYPFAIHPRLVQAGCVSQLDSGGFVWLNLAPDLLTDARVRTGFLVPAAPAPGVTPFGLLNLNHAIVAFLFEQHAIAVALIADNGEFLPPPHFIEGEILAEIAYGKPFEVMVHTRMDRHHLVVSQDELDIASGRVEKTYPHADPFIFGSYFIAPGSIRGLEWFFGPAEFRGVVSSDGYGTFPFGPPLGALWAERVGNVIRVTNRF